MASLPPYSTYRTDAKQMMFPQATSHGNILSFVPPGFSQELNIKFPDSRLAVCEKCKKNFKTRDMCRVRNTHSTPPWTTAYICITIDDSCLDQDGNFLDKPMTVRMVQWQPYCVKIPFGKKTPVCAACKRTNRTRSFCRERHKHRHLPWCTVYVLLSSLDAADPSTVVAGPSNPVEGAAEEREQRLKQKQEQEDARKDDKTRVNKDDKEGSNNQKEQAGDAKQEDPPSEVKEDPVPDDRTISSDPGDHGDDINDIPESRTFLAKVSCRSTSIHWLELSEFDSSEVASFPVAPDPHGQYHSPGMVDPNALYYGHPHQHPGMGYAAQQHQNALKSRQQYFFQMQQHHQQHYGQQPPPPPPQAWPTAPHYGDGTTAGEAAAAQQQQQQQPPLPPQWAMYYPGHYPPPPVPEGGMPEGQTVATPPQYHLQQQQLHHQPPPDYGAATAPATPMAAGGGPAMATPVAAENGTGTTDHEQPDSKRQRV